MTQTIKELVMAAGCFAYTLVRGSAKGTAHEPKRMVIIQLAKLGDMVCTTPMFAAVKKRYPGVHLTVMGSNINKQLLEHNPHVDEYVVFTGIVAMIKLLRSGRYDFGTTATPSMAALTVLFLGGVKTIVVPSVEGGRSPLETISYKFTRFLVATRPHTMGQYAPREYLHLLEPLGIHTDDTTTHLDYSTEAKQKIDDLFADHDLQQLVVGISPSAGNKVKEWPTERFAAVADELIEVHGASIILIGGPHDTSLAEAMKGSMRHAEKVLDVTAELSVDELKALMSRLSLFIAVDTGPVYVAEAFRVATVDIVGPMDENEQPPRGPRNLVVITPGHTPQMHILDAHPRDEREARRQVEEISVADVMREVESLL